MTDDRPVVLITGAGSGLGLASALFLAARNFRVYGTALTEAEERELREQAARRNVEVSALRMNVTRRADIDRTVDTIVREAGRIDAVVHFAGMGLRGFFEDLSMQEIRRLYDVNVFGIMELTQAVLPHMRARRSGRIVIPASASAPCPTRRRKPFQTSMIDLHTHTDRSDGTASPAQLVDDAKAMGLQALGITDHD